MSANTKSVELTIANRPNSWHGDQAVTGRLEDSSHENFVASETTPLLFSDTGDVELTGSQKNRRRCVNDHFAHDEADSAGRQDGGHLQQESVKASVRSLPCRFPLLRSGRSRRMFVNILLSCCWIITGMGGAVILPMLTGAFEKYTSCGKIKPIASGYFVTWILAVVVFPCQMLILGVIRLINPHFPFRTSLKHRTIFVISLLIFLSFFLMVLAGRPDRTPPMLQALFSLSFIPFTIALRCLILRKPVSAAKLICTFAVVIGLAISLEPTMFNMNGHGQHRPSHPAGSKASNANGSAFWSFLFLLSFLPNAAYVVLQEDALERKNVKEEDAIHPVVMITWMMAWNVVFSTISLLTEPIPGLGAGVSIQKFGSDIEHGLECLAGHGPQPVNCSSIQPVSTTSFPGTVDSDPDPHCLMPICRFWIQIGILLVDGVVALMLIKHTDGAIYMAIVQSLKSPLLTLFWMLFKLDKRSHFSWNPEFNTSTIYVLIGVLIILPAAFTYNLLVASEIQDSDVLNIRRSRLHSCNT